MKTLLKVIGIVTLSVVGVIAGLFLLMGGIIFGGAEIQDRLASSEPPPAPAPVSAEVLQERIALAKTIRILKAVKSNMRDPDSLTWVSIMTNTDASVICLEYRARNGFGGMNLEHGTYANGKYNVTAKAWNKNCANKPLNDMMKARYAV